MRARSNLSEPATQVFRINSRLVTHHAVIAVIMKQEFFGLALPPQWSVNPVLKCAGDDGPPEPLLRDPLRFVDIQCRRHVPPQDWPVPSFIGHMLERQTGCHC